MVRMKPNALSSPTTTKPDGSSVSLTASRAISLSSTTKMTGSVRVAFEAAIASLP
jgi:hypothetical protein